MIFKHIVDQIQLPQPDGVEPPFYETAGFPETFESLVADKVITPPSIREERVYRADATPPEGHENDIAYLITFQKL